MKFHNRLFQLVQRNNNNRCRRRPFQCRPQHTTSTTKQPHPRKGYQSLGSFHSDNLGVLLSLSDDDYQAPALPFDTTTNAININNEFLLDKENWTFLNHGAFGASLTVGYHRAEQWRWYLEQQPLRYFDRDLLPHLAYATRRLAAFCSHTGGDDRELLKVRQGLTLVQNATAGLNSVVKGFEREYGDKAHVIVWDTTYGSVKKLAQQVVGPEKVMEIPLQRDYLSRFSTTTFTHTQPFLEALDDAWSKHRAETTTANAKYLLVLDHTTSNTAINMPIEAIARYAKEQLQNNNTAIQVLVDGAHGLLAQPVDLQDYANADIDYYVANGHKWLSCPRGVGLLFCPCSQLRDTVLQQPAIISHGVEEPDLLSRFVWDGCRDYAAALSLPAVLDHWEAKGPTVVRATMRNTLLQGIQHLADTWHHGCPSDSWYEEGVTLVPTSLLSPMALVALPRHLSGNQNEIKTSNDAKQIQDFLFDKQIEVPLKCINGKLFVRVSCHVHNDLEEFDRLGQAILTFPI